MLYVAIGRRLGYPLKLVECKGHLFVRWEDAKERFNIEGTSRGLHGRIKTSSTPPEIKNRALINPAAGKRTEYWVYSLKRNAWTCMAENGASIGAPYGQAAYVARYGVLVAVPSTRVMRLDVEKLNWGVE